MEPDLLLRGSRKNFQQITGRVREAVRSCDKEQVAAIKPFEEVTRAGASR